MRAPASMAAHDCFSRPELAEPTIELATEQHLGSSQLEDAFAVVELSLEG